MRLLATALLSLMMLLSCPAVRAQTGAKASLSVDALAQERAQKLAEQQWPRTPIPLDPKQFDKYVGIYQTAPYGFVAFVRQDGHFFFHLLVQDRKVQNFELYPESPTKFFAKTMPLQNSFISNAQGKVTGVVVHTNGFELYDPKVDESVPSEAWTALAERIKNKTPWPGTEAALRRFIEAFEHGQPNYDDMIPSSALLWRESSPKYVDDFRKWGPLKSLTFVEVDPRGNDKYLAIYEHSRVEMIIGPLTPEGKIDGVRIGNIAPE